MENETQTEMITETTENVAEDTQTEEVMETQTEEVSETTGEVTEPANDTESVTHEAPVKTVSGSPLEPTKKLEAIELMQSKMSTPFILLFLFVVFFILKSFIYTKDDKRHGK